MLANKNFIKLCTDGTYKLTHGNWALLTVGVMSKHYGSDGKTYAFQSTFTPLAFCLANNEGKTCFQPFLTAVVQAGHALCHIDLTVAVKQFHADLAAGAELARQIVFPNSVRVSDFAHVIGVCRPGKQKAGFQDTAAHRSGMFSVVNTHLSSAGRSLLPLIRQTIHFLRCVPTATIFHEVATLLFDTLSNIQKKTTGEMVQFDLRIFFKWVVQPPSRIVFLSIMGWDRSYF